ncbi:MAG: Ig-like domain-containing protein, partial [Verrucomicrobiota bacterium]
PTRPDAFAVLAGSNGNVLGVLDNDRVLPGSSEALTVAAIVTVPTSGQASISADGLTVLYTPNPGFIGEDNFTYRATDSLGGTGVASVLVAVGGLAARNDFFAAPYDDPAITTDGGKVKFDVLANDPGSSPPLSTSRQ